VKHQRVIAIGDKTILEWRWLFKWHHHIAITAICLVQRNVPNVEAQASSSELASRVFLNPISITWHIQANCLVRDVGVRG